jgi:hypothetical protein
MGQAAKGDVGDAGEFVKIERLDWQLAPALKLRKDLGHRAALFRQRGEVNKPGLGMLENYANRLGTGIAGCPYNGDAYHILILIKK